MSRARLGLYVFAKAQLFADCYELTPSMKLLMARPQAPALLPQEYYGVRPRGPASYASAAVAFWVKWGVVMGGSHRTKVCQPNHRHGQAGSSALLSCIEWRAWHQVVQAQTVDRVER